MRLANKIALITGAASGIGLATSRRFAEEGATVFMADRDGDKLPAALAEVRALGGDHRSILFDVTSEEGWITALATVDKAFGRLDVLVNNAGYGKMTPIVETSLEQWRAIVAVNLDSVFLGTKHAMPLLARSGKGSIVNMSSIRGLVAGRGSGPYCAAKAGVKLFTKVTALECGAVKNGVRSNSVHPGHVATPLSRGPLSDPTFAQAIVGSTPMGRVAEPREIADAVVFLASDESSFMTGSELVVDGGATAH
jgi:NAD(P)-dependent dehydrogenase (short-subunit alcohol dehydrogenase family)